MRKRASTPGLDAVKLSNLLHGTVGDKERAHTMSGSTSSAPASRVSHLLTVYLNLPKSGLYKMLLYDSAHIQDTQIPNETHKINKTQKAYSLFSVQVQNVYMPLLQSLTECS